MGERREVPATVGDDPPAEAAAVDDTATDIAFWLISLVITVDKTGSSDTMLLLLDDEVGCIIENCEEEEVRLERLEQEERRKRKV